jgi:hypothetical protein
MKYFIYQMFLLVMHPTQRFSKTVKMQNAPSPDVEHASRQPHFLCPEFCAFRHRIEDDEESFGLRGRQNGSVRLGAEETEAEHLKRHPTSGIRYPKKYIC